MLFVILCVDSLIILKLILLSNQIIYKEQVTQIQLSHNLKSESDNGIIL